MKNKVLAKGLSAVLLLWASVMMLPAHAWPEVDTMNMCNQAVQTVRAYPGGAKSWANRDGYTATQGDRIYTANCPQVRAPVGVKAMPAKVYKKKIYRKKSASKTCSNCYKKGYNDGYRDGVKKR